LAGAPILPQRGAAQEFPETNMFETLAGQARQATRLLIETVENSPWLFIALAVVSLVLLIRRHRFCTAMRHSSLFPSGIDVAST